MRIDEAVKIACNESSLLDALTFICIWESERIVKQARENKQYDTCFKTCIKRVTEAYTAKSKDSARLNRIRRNYGN